MKQSRLWLMRLTCVLLVPLAACIDDSSSNLGTVTGTVKAGGKPLPGALVTFFPQPDGRPSNGYTQEDGSYELLYTRRQKGARVGKNIVRITTFIAGDGDAEVRESLPAKYNVLSELVEQVQPGKNVINFDLDYEGDVLQPEY